MTATFSEDRLHRYFLSRTWQPNLPRILYVMLNPSTADESVNDPTVERCERRARALEFGCMMVCNLYAFRSTDPEGLWRAADPIGPKNDEFIDAATELADTIVLGWGTNAKRLRSDEVARRVCALRPGKVWSLGTTKEGFPKHPLYISYATALEPLVIRRR